MSDRDPDELDGSITERLGHLAPSVDPDAATSAFGHRRRARARRRRAVAGGAMAALVLVVGVAALAATSGDDSSRVTAGEGGTTSVPTTTTPFAEGTRRVTTDDGLLAMQMDLPEEAVVGERMWLDLTLTNGRSEAITVDAVAPCHEPLAAVAGSIEAVNAVEADTGTGAFAGDPAAGDAVDGEQWDGDLATLPEVLSEVQAPKVLVSRPKDALVTSSTACADVLLPPDRVEPGESLTRRVAIDLRRTEPTPIEGGSLEVLASTGAVATAGGEDLGRVTVSQPVTIREPIDRQPSYDAAVAADGIAAAPTLADWVTMTKAGLPADVEQTWSVSLNWWNGAWEAWIHPTYASGHQGDPLRIRFDPERSEVVDVRTTFWNMAPSDDPDQTTTEAVDEIRYQAD